MTYAEANPIKMVEYLNSLGIQPQKIRNNDYWPLSSLRAKKTAFFKVTRKPNAWYNLG